MSVMLARAEMDDSQIESAKGRDEAPAVSAVILNYRNPELTARCVNTVLVAAEESGMAVQVTIIDNSGVETAEALRRLFPATVRIVANSQNLGFAKANNQGIQLSEGRYVLLLNNDCFLNGECLKTGVEFLDEHREVGVWAPRLTNEDGSFQVSCARSPSLKGLAGEYLLARYPDWYANAAEWTTATRVEAATGAFLLIRRKVIERVGLLDEDFFFNVEDMDYCWRVRAAGFAIVYDPRASAVHLGGASQEHKRLGRQAFIRDPYLHRYRILYFRKHGGVLAAGLAFAIIRVGLTLRRVKECLRSASRSSSTR